MVGQHDNLPAFNLAICENAFATHALSALAKLVGMSRVVKHGQGGALRNVCSLSCT